MQGLPIWLCGFNLQLVQLMERFSVFFLSHPVPGVQLCFYPHLCVWSTYRSLVLRLPWSSWVCPSEDRVKRWSDCLDCGSPGSANCAGKPAATGARDMAIVRGFSGSRWPAHESQPWDGFSYFPAASMWGPPLMGAFFIAQQLARKSQPWSGFFYCHRPALACGEREVTIVAPPPACDSAVVPCFCGSPVFLCRHSLLWISSLPSRLSPHSQQQFLLWVCSPVHMLQLPAPLHTCEHTSQSRAHRAMVQTICVVLTLSSLPQISHFTLFQQPQMLPFCPNWFPHQRRGFPIGEGVSLNLGISPLLQLPLPRVQVPSCFLSSSFSLLFFIPPSYAGIFIVLIVRKDYKDPVSKVFCQCSVGVLWELLHL